MTFIIISISSGLDSAVNNVIATSVLLDITNLPFLTSLLFLFKNSKNNVAAILLHPSAKGWSLTKKYNRCAALSSIVGYNSVPNTFWYTASNIPFNLPFFSMPNKFESLLNFV